MMHSPLHVGRQPLRASRPGGRATVLGRPGGSGPHGNLRRAACGFTLVDILITAAILGILGSVAYPSVAGVMARGARAEGRIAAARMLMEQERYYSQANTYVAVDPAAASGQVLRNFSGDTRAASKYLLGARPCTNAALDQCVEVYAVPQFGGGDPDVGVLTIRSVGAARGCSGSKPKLCWPS